MVSEQLREAAESTEPIGAVWLVQHFGLQLMGRLPVASQIGGRRSTKIVDGFRLEVYPEAMRPDSNTVAHLQFHLRHEVPHLEFLTRLFQKIGSGVVQTWIEAEPTGQYARRAGFLYEWLTGDFLTIPPRLAGNYVDALDPEKVVTASPAQTVKDQRWRINDNMPGTRHFCPLVVRTEQNSRAMNLDVPHLFAELKAEFGEELIMRAAVWMTLRESKASFAIEGEGDRVGRVQRFADVMARRTGQGEMPLSEFLLAEMQHEILGERASLQKFGLRQSPVFVGETVRYQEVVHYVAPPHEDVSQMLEGLRTFLERTKGQSAVMRSAVASFGFVYIHPLADGNGRMHRFLVNDILRRDGMIPAPVILPISSVITDDGAERREYDLVLDRVSKPLVHAVRDQIQISQQQTTYPDGVVSNFCFHGNDLARPIWRYPDLGPHVVFLSRIVERTIVEQMRSESRYLRTHARARAALKEVVEMPDPQADRVLRSIEQNRGVLSRVLAKEIPVLAMPGVWDEVVQAVADVFTAESVCDDGDTEDAIEYPRE